MADLGGWYLTDNEANLEKWRFPSNTTIPKDGFLLIFASGQESEDYRDPDGFLHTNFRLSTGGEYLALVRDNGVTIASEVSPAYPPQFNDISYGTFQPKGAQRDLLGSAPVAVFVADSGAPAADWALSSFTPGAGWIAGLGQGAGYDTGSAYDAFIETDIEAEMSGRATTAYLRYPFSLSDPARVIALGLTIRYDDGFVAYLNGEQIGSRNALDEPAWDDVADESINEDENVVTIDVTDYIAKLRPGENVFAVHGLNRSDTSSDFLIVPRLMATFAGDGPAAQGYLREATPGGPNGDSSTPGPAISHVRHLPDNPHFSEDIVVRAEVSSRLTEVVSAELVYRVDFGPESVLAMQESGGSYVATIPSSSFWKQ